MFRIITQFILSAVDVVHLAHLSLILRKAPNARYCPFSFYADQEIL